MYVAISAVFLMYKGYWRNSIIIAISIIVRYGNTSRKFVLQVTQRYNDTLMIGVQM